MPISNPVLIQFNSSTSSSSIFSNTVGVGGVPAGPGIISAIGVREGGSAYGISDDAANSYVVVSEAADHTGASRNLGIEVGHAPDASALVQNDLITWDWTTDINLRVMGSLYVEGLDGNGPTNGPTVAPVQFDSTASPSSGAVATPAGEWIAIGIMAYIRLGNPVQEGSEDIAGGWTEIGVHINSTEAMGMRLSYQKGSGTGGVTWAPTFTNTHDGFIVPLVFSAAAAGGPSMVILRRRMEGY